MPLDPVIAGGFRGVQLPDPLEGYARVQQIRAAQQQNELARMQLEQRQQEQEVSNRLRSLDPTSPEYISEVTRINPQLGSELMLRSKQAATAQRQAEAADL
jgi:predicted DNA binding CopG/RHH family protein